MSSIIDINTYDPIQSDKFFFDANIWIYLYCPIGSYRKDVIKKYSNFFKKVIEAKSSILISSLVLSEFFNAYARIEFNCLRDKEPSKYKNFKRDFRDTKKYKALVKAIRITSIKILDIAIRFNDQFEHINLDELFKDIEKMDFNDNYYSILASIEKFKIVTNDYDFILKKGIPILTANPKLLKTSR